MASDHRGPGTWRIETAVSIEVPSLPLTEAAPAFAVLLCVLLAAPLVARRARLPEVVVLIVAGVLVGPTGAGLLERDGPIELLGAIGLLYLMFMAGIELELDDFRATRRASLVFGALTFAVPLALGTLVALWLGLELFPAVLIGSCWSSHTLLSYPQFRRAGTSGHPVVGTTVGATIVTDTAALLVLVVVVRADAGDLGPAFWLTLVPAFGAVVLATITLLPRLTRAFFAGPGQDGVLRLLFVLSAVYVVAALTQLSGVEPIVGAFLAGLALNRSVPSGGVLMDRVELLGSALLVPVFLVATGMLVDPALLLRPDVLRLGAAFAVVATAAKWLAAELAGRVLGFDRDARLAMFGLSNAQAAATLAAVVVGREAGLLGEGVVDAVVLVILVTCVTSSVVSSRVAGRLRAGSRDRPLGGVVVTPVANPATARGLLELAAALARGDGGLVVPLVVASSTVGGMTVDQGRDLLGRVVTLAQSAGVEARPALRVDATPRDGISHAAAELDATVLLLGRPPGSPGGRLGGVVGTVLERVEVPTLVLADVGVPPARVVVLADAGGDRAAVALGLRAAAACVLAYDVPVVVVVPGADPDVVALVDAHLGDVEVVSPPRHRAGDHVLDVVRAGDLVVVPAGGGTGGWRPLVHRLPEDVATLVTVALGPAAPSPRTARGPARDDGPAPVGPGEPAGLVTPSPAPGNDRALGVGPPRSAAW